LLGPMPWSAISFHMRRLDPAQAAAARSDAPVQVTLAGPGSGKASTLTGRFVHLTLQGVDPRHILAVTFTRKAADEMRNRIARLLQLSTRFRSSALSNGKQISGALGTRPIPAHHEEPGCPLRRQSRARRASLEGTICAGALRHREASHNIVVTAERWWHSSTIK